MSISQKKLFLKSEGDNYFLRNQEKILKKNFSKDKITKILKSYLKKNSKKKILEIGCSAGLRLSYLKKIFTKSDFYGIDPSKKAINSNKDKSITLRVGTADNIAMLKKYDFIIFGFCLYVCDDNDLFKIASDTYKLANKNAYIIIEDFDTGKTIYENYKHKKDLTVRKMNYAKIFTWHPKIILIKKYFYKFKWKLKSQKDNISVVILKKK